MQTIAEQIGAYATNLKYQDIPAEVLHQAKRTITDTLGCALGGYDSGPAKIARDLAGLVSSSQPATILYSGQKTSVDLAAFANDAMVRSLDFNDGYVGKGGGHPSDSIAALLAAAEAAQAGGRDLLLATVLTYEVYCRIADAWNDSACGLDHVTTGGIASVAGVARLLGLTQQQTIEAINIMVAGNTALNQTRIGNVSNWKGCAYANANRNAIFAAQLAARGMTGPSPIFEGVGGYFKAVARKTFTLDRLGGRDGAPFKIMECLIKRFPLGQYSQTVCEAALQMRETIASPDDIAEIQIKTVTTAIVLMADTPEKWEPRNRETADHSMPYTVAVALIHGDVQEEHFDDAHVNSPAIRALTRKVKIKASAEADKHMPHAMRCYFKLITTSGETFSTVVDHHRGHFKNPMNDAEIEKKFRTLAKKVLPDAQTDRLLARLWKLDAITDAGDIPRLTVRS